jgi:hypothetical protein
MREKAQYYKARPDNCDSKGTKREVVYFDTPTFSPASNGIKCIYHLAEQLANIGVDVKLLPRDLRAIRINLPSKFKGLEICMPWQVEGPATLICTESVPARTIKIARRKGLRIFWWYLAPHGLLEKQKTTPSPGEKLAVFSPYVFPEKEYYYFQPSLDNHWLHAIRKHRPRTDHKKLAIGVYCGKGLLKALPEELRSLMVDAEIQVISRTSPKTRSGLFSLLSDLDGLVTFDELTQLNLEAASIGIPIFIANPLFPSDASTLFPLPIEDLATSDHKEFILRIDKRRLNQTRQLSASTLYSLNDITIDRIMKDLECASWGWSTAATERYKNITRYGQDLRRKNKLAPYYGGQSAGTYFFRLYMAASLTQPRYFYHFACMLISLLDQIGRFFYLIGFSKAFEIIIARIKKSKSARSGARVINKYRT